MGLSGINIRNIRVPSHLPVLQVGIIRYLYPPNHKSDTLFTLNNYFPWTWMWRCCCLWHCTKGVILHKKQSPRSQGSNKLRVDTHSPSGWGLMWLTQVPVILRWGWRLLLMYEPGWGRRLVARSGLPIWTINDLATAQGISKLCEAARGPLIQCKRALWKPLHPVILRCRVDQYELTVGGGPQPWVWINKSWPLLWPGGGKH
jgi:hypothetical protein